MEDDENLFIIMGYCEDGDLHTKIKVSCLSSCKSLKSWRYSASQQGGRAFLGGANPKVVCSDGHGAQVTIHYKCIPALPASGLLFECSSFASHWLVCCCALPGSIT